MPTRGGVVNKLRTSATALGQHVETTGIYDSIDSYSEARDVGHRHYILLSSSQSFRNGSNNLSDAESLWGHAEKRDLGR